MSEVVSLGSINVDRIQYLPRDRIRGLEQRYDWFPVPGQTVEVNGIPAGLADRDYRNYLGGKGANQAVAAANVGADAAFLGTVGTDQVRYDVLPTLSARGVAVDGVAVTDAETGKAYIYVDNDGESSIAIVAGANGETDRSYALGRFDTIVDARVLLLQNEIPVATMQSVLSRLAGVDDRPTVIYNPSPAEGASPLVTADAVDIVVVNESEYCALSAPLERFAGTLVRTQGSDTVRVSGATEYRTDPPPVDPVDTTGAGDAFAGVLAARLAAGDAIEQAVDTATTAASRSTEIEGAQQAMTALDDLLELRTP